MKLTPFAVTLTTGVFIGLALGMPLGAALAPPAQAEPSTTIQEDDPAWDCTMDGDHVCGPENSNHVPPGLYDQGGVLVTAWPTIVTCSTPPGAILDVCDRWYVDPKFVHLTAKAAHG